MRIIRYPRLFHYVPPSGLGSSPAWVTKEEYDRLSKEDARTLEVKRQLAVKKMEDK